MRQCKLQRPIILTSNNSQPPAPLLNLNFHRLEFRGLSPEEIAGRLQEVLAAEDSRAEASMEVLEASGIKFASSDRAYDLETPTAACLSDIRCVLDASFCHLLNSLSMMDHLLSVIF